ncbi:MAG: xylose isomerase [Conexibacter sp.]|nr:xylose isomerase [Conexibacter sp.]
MSDYVPAREHRFSFGLWTVGQQGRDPFGDPTRAPLDPVDSVRRLGQLGAAGVSLHDNDLVPFGSSAHERDRLLARFRAALEESGMRVTTATTNLFTHPIFRDGAFTSNDRQVRRFALRKTLDAIDLGAELGASTYVFWGGREGSEVTAAKPPVDAFERYREALDILCGYVREQGYDLRLALEPKPNEPRGDSFVATVGHALALIDRLEHPELVGVNPEVAHETMAGLNFCHAVALAIWAGKLFHIDLNSQRIGRFDQDLRFGQEDLKEAFLLVRLLESSGYDGPRHFDAHALRVEDAEGVWAFAAGCMRTYLILAEKARAFDADPRVVDALATAGADTLGLETLPGGYSAQAVRALREETFDVDALAARGYANERLDQLVVEHLLGV